MLKCQFFNTTICLLLIQHLKKINKTQRLNKNQLEFAEYAYIFFSSKETIQTIPLNLFLRYDFFPNFSIDIKLRSI